MTENKKYKLVIPKEVENKIRHVCSKVWNIEWSGVLFYDYAGSFENDDLVLTCRDFYVLDIGDAGSTTFEFRPEVMTYMADHNLLNCQSGLIHSHHSMEAFFSTTDSKTLNEEGTERNNFLSLIVNNKGQYVARVTRKTHSNLIKEVKKYNFFGEGEREIVEEYEDNSPFVESFDLVIENQGREVLSFPELDEMLDTIKKEKEEAEKKRTWSYPGYSTPSYSRPYYSIKNTVNQKVEEEYKDWTSDWDNFEQQPVFFPEKKKVESKIKLKNPKEEIDKIAGDEWDADDTYDYPANAEILDNLTIQLLTGSILLNKDKDLDLEKWASSMKAMYEKRFGGGEKGMADFRLWAETYVDYLVTSIEDKSLENAGLKTHDIISVYARELSYDLNFLPSNPYLDVFIECLDCYIN